MRVCKKCGGEKPLLDFPINNTLASGILRKHTCNSCRNHQSKVRQRLHKENIRPDKGVCPICKKTTTKLVLDHNHETDKFRGWLCNDCNNALGKFGDDVRMLQNAIEYLSEEQTTMYRPLPFNVTVKESEIEGLGLFATMGIPAKTNLGVSHYFWDDRLIRTPLGGFYNHAEIPNCYSEISNDYAQLITLRDIEEGEEITCFYSINPFKLL